LPRLTNKAAPKDGPCHAYVKDPSELVDGSQRGDPNGQQRRGSDMVSKNRPESNPTAVASDRQRGGVAPLKGVIRREECDSRHSSSREPSMGFGRVGRGGRADATR